MTLRPLLLCLAALPALVAPLPAIAANNAAATVYIEPAALPPQLLPSPPEEGSASWRAQEDAVIAEQENVTKADIAAMRNEQHMRMELVTKALGPDFTVARLPETFALLNRVLATTSGISEADKKFWHTRRPYLTDHAVKLFVDPIDRSPAYPSGHTSESRVLAEVLGLLLPSRRETLRARADEIALHRVEAGVHYPCDVEGGQLLAMLIVGALMQNADFQQDLATASNEIAKTGF